jgi:hypothetical protein
LAIEEKAERSVNDSKLVTAEELGGSGIEGTTCQQEEHPSLGIRGFRTPKGTRCVAIWVEESRDTVTIY